MDLTELGIQEANHAGDLLKDRGMAFDHAYTSYLKRAVKTLNCVLDHLDQDWLPVSKSWRLNEKHYGMLQGLNKSETAQKYGDEQVLIWRRSYDVAPPPLAEDDPANPKWDPRYKGVPDSELPRTESLKETIARMMPYWEGTVLPSLRTLDNILIVAHGNTLRGMIKYLKNIPDEQLLSLNLPTATPYVFEFDDSLNLEKDYFLGDPEEIRKRMAAVAGQGSAKKKNACGITSLSFPMTAHSCRIAFFDAKPYDRDSFNSVNEREFHYDIRYFKGHLTPDSVPLTRGTDVACIFVNDTANREVIRNLKENGVKLLALRCAGFNNVDLKAAEEAELPVVRVPQYSPYAVAEHAVALMLSLNRKIHRAYWRTRDGNFSLHGLMGFDMNGKTAGIIGTGKIARILIRILKGFGMNILAYDLHPDQRFAEEAGITYTTLDDLYARSDIISLHCPLTPETEHLINTDSIGKMKDGVMIINTGRGKLINTEMLIDGLKSKKVGAAGLDVYEEEGEYFYEDKSDRIIDDDTLARLLSFNNVILTSHQGFFTKEALHNIAEVTLHNIRDFLESKPLINRVSLQSR